MRRSNKNAFQGKKKFAILVDGECEFWYFQMLKRNKRSLSIDLKPEIPQKKTVSEQYKKVLEYEKIYDKVIWVVDLDVISAETMKAKKGTKTAMQTFHDCYKKLEKKNKVIVIVNNPCLEFWFLLHFEATAKYFDNCEGAAKQLKKKFPGYEKTQDFFTKEGNDIFLKLQSNLETAIANAEKLEKFHFDNTQTGLSEMQLFFQLEEIKGIRIKQADVVKPA